MIKKVLIFLLLISHPLIAQWTQVGDIFGESAHDQSGWSVDLNSNGNVIAIGATGNDGNGSASGQVRIYEQLNGIWTQIGADINGVNSGDRLGYAVSLNSEGSVVAISAFDHALGPRYVSIFEYQNGVWTQKGDNIISGGNSISLNSNGNILAIGNRSENLSKIYEFQGGWIQIGTDIIGEFSGDSFGSSISLSSNGSIVAIGGLGNDGNGSGSGHVRIYENQNGTWIQIGDDIDGEAAGDTSGRSLGLSSDGSIVAIGANWNNGNGNDSGHVRIYENQNGTWIQIGDDIDGEAESDNSGLDISLNSSGTVVAIGAPYNDDNGCSSGHVRVYENQSGVWVKIGNDINGDASNDDSGWSVSLNSSGSRVAIGATRNNGNTTNDGQARIFENTDLLSIDSKNIVNIAIHPNPTFDKININLKEYNVRKIEISDTLGKKLISFNDLQQRMIIDISDFENGIYLIKLYLSNQIFIKKIIKK